MRRDFVEYLTDTGKIILLCLTTIFVAYGNHTALAGSHGGKKKAEEGPPIHHVSSKVCAECHSEIFSQWKGSMHANSTALKDPIHATFYKMVMGDPKQEGVKSKKGKYPVCLKCHVPNMAIDKKTKIDSKVAYQEGVNCIACHTLGKFKGTTKPNGKPALGIDAYELTARLQGPAGVETSFDEDEDDGNPHNNKSGVVNTNADSLNLPMSSNTLLKGNGACMGCHDKRSNGKGVPLCATGDEIKHSNSEQTCQSCHMPVNGDVMDHSMGGGHSSQMLKRALILDMEVQKGGPMLITQVHLANHLPHNVPTGAPFRNMKLKVTAYDAKGNVIWSNYKKHPAKEDPQAYFDYKLMHNGVPTSPPKATAPGPDNRLKPNEKRMITYQIPANGVSMVKAEMFYNLLWPGLNKKFKHLPKDLRAAKRFAFKEVKLN